MPAQTNGRLVVFEELHRLTQEYDACKDAEDHWNVDDALSQLIVRLNGETRRARKLRDAGSETKIAA
jgi:hypothetical protein